MEHQAFLFNLAYRALNDRREAEDVAQDAFVRAWQGLPRFRGQSQFRTWLYRIATNLCYNRIPRLRQQLAALGEEHIAELPDAISVDPARIAEADERRAYLHGEIGALPESYRLLILLRYQRELSYEEIAQVLDLPVGTVKTGLFRARARLRARLREYEGESG
jgi:RNA polymerase sigma-70 factor (ECF subfamily)